MGALKMRLSDMEENLFKAGDVIGKTLYSRVAVPLTRYGWDEEKPFKVVPAGELVGVVDSYVLPKAGRSRLWWMFYGPDGRQFMAEHKAGAFDIGVLRGQGVLSVAEQIEQEKKDKESLVNKGERIATKFFVIGAAVWLLSRVISSRVK